MLPFLSALRTPGLPARQHDSSASLLPACKREFASVKRTKGKLHFFSDDRSRNIVENKDAANRYLRGTR